MPDGIFLLSCTKGDHKASGIAYYSNFSQTPDGNDGQQPNVFKYTSDGFYLHWEGQQMEATFDDGVKVVWNLRKDAFQTGRETVVGTASNGSKSWTVKRDKDTFMFQNADGFDCVKHYYAA